ncbi:MAG: radical SAM protein [Acidobacteria bacterium]|nr:radical SAM protein [Acidobacteriota bacterium]
MTIELRPLGVNCNIACQYCYQNPQRDANNLSKSYNIDKMKNAILAYNKPFTLFGGEPLLIPEKDLEEILSWGYSKFGKNSIQTNGTLINKNHIRMFKQYAVSIGISIDGPGELNDVRWAGSLEKTRLLTEKSEKAIELLCKEGIRVNLIITLHRANATTDKLAILNDWIKYLDKIGVKFIRLHALEVDHYTIRDKYALSEEENLRAFVNFAELELSLSSLKLDVFTDIEKMLLADDKSTTCVWMACDPYTTASVQGIEGDGKQSNCGRTNKDGIDFIKAKTVGYERYLALYYTPQEFGGCNECKFFLSCKGQCPGTAIDNDWRNRTEHCGLWKELFQRMEERLVNQGKTPISLHPDRPVIEDAMLKAWEQGSNPTLSSLVTKLVKNNTTHKI